MTFRFGFELEGFYMVEGEVKIPPKHYPHDDFPGLVEVRTTGGGNLREQIFMLYAEGDKYDKAVDFEKYEHKFSPKDRTIIRSRHYEKGGVAINNIYGKAPRDIGSKTLASFQINISNFLGTGEKGRDHYGTFDFIEIIRNFDKEFSEEIKASNRQPGFYSIKENIRMEYRSLPNFVALSWTDTPTELIKRIEKCL